MQAEAISCSAVVVLYDELWLVVEQNTSCSSWYSIMGTTMCIPECYGNFRSVAIRQLM